MSGTGLWPIFAKITSPFVWTAIGILSALVLFVIPQSGLDAMHVLGPDDVLRPYVGWTFLLAVSLLATRLLFAIGGGMRRARERREEQNEKAWRMAKALDLLINPTPEFARHLHGMREAGDQGISVGRTDRIAEHLVRLGIADRLPGSDHREDRIRFSLLTKAMMAEAKSR